MVRYPTVREEAYFEDVAVGDFFEATNKAGGVNLYLKISNINNRNVFNFTNKWEEIFKSHERVTVVKCVVKELE